MKSKTEKNVSLKLARDQLDVVCGSNVSLKLARDQVNVVYGSDVQSLYFCLIENFDQLAKTQKEVLELCELDRFINIEKIRADDLYLLQVDSKTKRIIRDVFEAQYEKLQNEGVCPIKRYNVDITLDYIC